MRYFVSFMCATHVMVAWEEKDYSSFSNYMQLFLLTFLNLLEDTSDTIMALTSGYKDIPPNSLHIITERTVIIC